jgi:zinc protease
MSELRRGPSPIPSVMVASALIAFAPALQAQTSALEVPPIPVETFTLDNGLTVLVSEDHSTPVVAVNMWYHVGSAHEEPGRSGFAHLFEHMLFEETENLADGQMDELVNRAGGSYNGTTNTDRTAYFEVLPSNRLNLALWLHAERMARLRVSAENFDNQREVVKEERRLRVENQPYVGAQLTLDTLAQQDFRPYAHTVIGSMDDLNAATVDDVRRFYNAYYAPNNAVLAIVGDVTVDEARALVEEYLGDIPPGEAVPELPEAPAVPRTNGERRVTVDDPLAQLPLLWMAYNLPPGDSDDHYALALLSRILSTGESSRLRERLVNREQAALELIAQVDRRVGPGLFLFGALPNQGVEVETLEGLIDEEISRLQAEPVTERELEKVRNQLLTEVVMQRMTVQNKASQLQQYALIYGDAARINEELERYQQVTLEDIQRVARTYLVPENRTVVLAAPARPAGE